MVRQTGIEPATPGVRSPRLTIQLLAHARSLQQEQSLVNSYFSMYLVKSANSL